MGGSAGRHPRVRVLRPRPTMVDVAREAGVALKTLSRAVNDEPRVRPAPAAPGPLALAPLRLHRHLLGEGRRGTPGVFLLRPPRGIEADVVLLDDRAGARAGVAALLEAGHRRIGVVGGPEGRPAAAERLAGARDALSAAGLPLEGALVRLGVEDAAAAAAAPPEPLALQPPASPIFAPPGRPAPA